MKGTASTRNGLTLVEVIIAVLIISIVAAIAVPQFQKMAANANLKAAARELMADFATLKQRAMSENMVYKITFHDAEDSNNYAIQEKEGVAIQVKSPALFGAIKILNASFGRGKTITFHTRGTASAGHVVLVDERNSTATITVNFAGRTHVRFDFN